MKAPRRRMAIAAALLLGVAATAAAPAQGGLLNGGDGGDGGLGVDRVSDRVSDHIGAAIGPLRLPQDVRRVADIAYGAAPRQRFDVYLPAPKPAGALRPIIVMVHGGAWVVGNKSMPQVVENKVAHWVPQGAIFVSVNYRLLPAVTPAEQADDVARALAKVQALASDWGGDARRIVLMGHSAGAHLVALASASPAIRERAATRPWLGTVVLDSAALDLSALMRGRHARLYDRAFGSDAARWPAMSPTDALAPGGPPLLLVCSTLRPDRSCDQSSAFARQAQAQGLSATVSPQALTHAEINANLGLPGAETDAVDAFLRAISWWSP